ncbi:MAG: nicotinate (nicotinamide) nucleotide adenylyltransferase [Bacillales bacterium]|nr:nicotinate (nicotinamide) nucleotide adenylyltransferase [Bacillales bacterium]
MEKIIILGGSFDPIHNEHINIALYSKEFLKADKILFIPARLSRWKDAPSSPKFRLKLLRYAIKDIPDIEISTVEINGKKKDGNYTYNTLRYLKQTSKEREYYFLIGSDKLERLPDWYKIDELNKICQFVVFNRPNYPLIPAVIAKYNLLVVDYKAQDVSSSQVRDNLDYSNIPLNVKNYLLRTNYYLKKLLKQNIKEERYKHSIRVALLAKRIAKSLHYNQDKAYLAGLIHDCGKNQITDKIMLEHYKEFMYLPHPVWHQFTGTYIAENIYNVKDKEILDSITYHTTGNKEMSLLAKIIYFADKAEEGRGYNSQPFIDLALKNFDEAFILLLKDNYEYLKSHKINNSNIFSQACYTYYLKEREK